GPVVSRRAALLNCEAGEKKLVSEATSGRVKVPPGWLFHTALFLKVSDCPARTVALPKLSTERVSRLAKNPPEIVVVPLSVVCPVPPSVPCAQVKGPLTVTSPVPVRVPKGLLSGRFWAVREPVTVTVPPLVGRVSGER